MIQRLVLGLLLLVLLGCDFAGLFNQPPTITSPARLTIEAEIPFTYTATADDPDNDPVTFSFSNLPPWLTDSNATVYGTPMSFRDASTFRVHAADPHDGEDELLVTLDIQPGAGDTLRNLVALTLEAIHLDSLSKTVLQLSGELPVAIGDSVAFIQSRYVDEPGNQQAAGYLEKRLADYGLIVARMPYSITGENVYAIQEGTIYPDEFYIISAHYDCLPAFAIAPGADDNASGVAVVMEAARLLTPLSSRYSIIYALWDEEEIGWLGSLAFTNHAKIQGWDIRGAINVDMVAWDDDDDGTILVFFSDVANSSALADTVLWANEFYAIGLNPLLLDWAGSDYGSFWASGFGATGIGEYYDTDLNPCFHRACDTFSLFNLSYFHRATRLAISTIAVLAHIRSDQAIVLAAR